MDPYATREENKFYEGIVRRANIQGVTMKARIGGGTNGNIFLGVDKYGRERAYKIFNDNRNYPDIDGVDPAVTSSIYNMFAKEAAIYAKLGNRNPGVCSVSEIGSGYITLCLADHNLWDEIASRRGPSKIEDCLPDMISLLTAIEMLHQEGVAHLDLKPANILRNKDGKLKICDLGSGVVMREQDMARFNQARSQYPNNKSSIRDLSNTDARITYMYAPPENFRDLGFDNSLRALYPVADVWSLGAVFFEMVTGIAFSSLLYNEAYPDYRQRPANAFGEFSNSLDLLKLFTGDMKIDGFSVYSARWREYMRNFDPREINNKSPGGMLYRSQAMLNNGQFLSGEDKANFVELWDLLRKMLDPNPLTRITASECANHPLFNKEYILDIRTKMWEEYLSHDFPLEYKTPTSYKPSELFVTVTQLFSANKNKTREEADTITATLSLFPNARRRFFRLFRIIDSVVSGVTLESAGPFVFCILMLAIYAEYGIFYNVRVINNDLKVNLLRNMAFLRDFSPTFTGDDRMLRIHIALMFYYLLVEVLQFNLWM